jgi:uncharacterized protein YkwD
MMKGVRVTSPLLAALSLVLACRSGSPTPQGSAPAARPPRATTTTTAPANANDSRARDAVAIADEIVVRTNAERRNAGLPALARNVNLMHAAQIQADQMAAEHRLDHSLPKAAYPTLASRLQAVSYQISAAGENIGEGYRTASAAVAGWMASPGHRANILSTKFTEMGAGIATAKDGTGYTAQVFASPR